MGEPAGSERHGWAEHANPASGKKTQTYIIPISLGELDGRGSPLNACTVDEDMYFAAHGVERPLKNKLHGFEVGEVTFHHFDCASQSGDGVVGVAMRWRGRPLYETDVRTSFGEGYRTGGTNA